MKKIAICGATFMALLACSQIQEEDPGVLKTKELTFTAYRAEADTKTERQPGGSVYWNPSDAVSVFFINGDNGGSKFVAQNTEAVATAQFKGTIDVISGGGEGENHEFWFWGVYPYSSENSCDGSSITTVIPKTQEGKAGTFADNTFVTMARSKGLSLGFYNICTGVKFTLTRDDIKEVRIRGNKGEDLAGKVNVEWDANGKPAITQYVDGAKEVAVTAPGGGTFATGTEYYLVLAPTLFTEGFTMSLVTDDEKLGYFVHGNERQFNRGIFINISNLDTRVTSWVDIAAKEVPEEGGNVELEVMSSEPCHAVIPEEAQSWISEVPSTKSVEKKTITLKIEANTGAARSATVIVKSEDGALVLPYLIEQGPNHDYQLTIEKNALMAIYNSVSAESQSRMNGWGTDESLSSWYGVTLSPSGFVETLRLFDVDFVKSMPAEIGGLIHLKDLCLYGTNLSGVYGKEGYYLAPELGDLKELESLFIQRQDFVGAIPVELSQLRNLKTLVIQETGINGIIPPEICSLENLEVLGLQFNPLTGTIPHEIGQLRNLRCLYLHGKESNLSGAIPVELCSLTKLEELYLGAKLSGVIPPEIGQLTNLKSLTINWSSITGEIPEEIGNLSNLVSLQIDDSPITGSLPRSLVNCKKLENLFIEVCPITGPLPAWISELESLKRLSFSGTNMSGMIPKEWAQSPLLYDINLSRCPYLYGNIPEEVMGMNAFKYRWGNWVNGTNFNLIGVKIPAPDFNVTSLEGVSINSAEEYTNNKFTILFQWNYWCPSITETPTLVNLYNKYHEQGLNVIGWSDDDAPEYFEHPHPMSETIAQYGMPWQNFVVPAGETEGYGVFGNMINKYPGGIAGAIALVDEDGYIIWSNLYDSMENLTKIIEDYYEEGDPKVYSSTDYSADGVVNKLQTASEGEGVNLILMGDGFSDRMIANGTYHNAMNRIADAFFSEEPYTTFKSCFNVYEVNVVSKNEIIGEGSTALRTWFGSGTQVGGNNSLCMNYALKAISSEEMDDAIIIVAINSDSYAGTCYMYPVPNGDYSRGVSVAYFPTSSDTDTFNGLVSHEAGGHGFAKLADEYAYESMGAISADAIANTKAQEPYGWWKNVDFTSDPATVKWSQFLSDPRYASEGLGCFEGGLTYWTGVWRPTDASIMRYNTGGFNAPSRYAIWYRIGKLAYGESWEGSYEDFVAYDTINRTPAAVARRDAQRRRAVQKPLPQLPPPVVVGHSWREELQKGK
ncbi:MAG: redoxin domain-containing protein [Bacteroidales bacterium]|nr:redoxin domain-containing protein [Bacteroidales bacterium]